MKLKCPTCKEPLNDKYTCSNKHQFFLDEDVLVLLDEQFKIKLTHWLSKFENFRLDTLPQLDFENLPHAGVKINKNLWKARIADLKLITNVIQPHHQSVLDVGSWNGWLANSLSQLGKTVTAVDYFIHELDGLKARKHFTNPSWTSIQMDLENLAIFENQFDVIILNRCLAYFTDIHQFIEMAKQLLAPKGLLIITGINISSSEAEELTKAKVLFKEKYQQNLFFKASKGYLDPNDLKSIQQHAIQLQVYPNWKNWIKKILFPHKGVAYYGIYSKTANK